MRGDVAFAPAEARQPGEGILAGERDAIRADGYRTGTIVKAARTCEYVSIESLLNLDAVTAAARGAGGDVVVLCAGCKRAFAPEVVPA